MSRAYPRVGVLIPASDTGFEVELPTRLAGVASAHFARVALASVVTSELREFVARARDELPLILAAEPSLLVLGCTSGTFVLGREREEAELAQLREAVGVEVISTAQAMAAALLRRGQRVRLRASYDDELLALEAEYLRSWGLSVTSCAGLGITDDQQTAELGLGELGGLVAGVDEADVVMLSCTNIRTLAIHRSLEAAAGQPVVSSVQAVAESLTRHMTPATT